jgi:hypothetical protein
MLATDEEADMTVKYELTDTWAGTPNYGWVKRGTLTLPDDATQCKIMREVKKALDLTGEPCRVERLWNGWVIKPRGMVIGWITRED